MIKYSALNYTTPPRNQGQIVEVSYAVTRDELVSRSTDRSDGTVQYQTADLCEVIGKLDLHNRCPSVPDDCWDTVDGDDETPD
jgi:hypothetical protein